MVWQTMRTQVNMEERMAITMRRVIPWDQALLVTTVQLPPSFMVFHTSLEFPLIVNPPSTSIEPSGESTLLWLLRPKIKLQVSYFDLSGMKETRNNRWFRVYLGSKHYWSLNSRWRRNQLTSTPRWNSHQLSILLSLVQSLPILNYYGDTDLHTGNQRYDN